MRVFLAASDEAWLRKRYAEMRACAPEYVHGEALKQIANFPDEEDEWDAVEKYRKVREIATAAVKNGNRG